MKSQVQINSAQQIQIKKENNIENKQIKNPQSIATRKAAAKLKQKQTQIQILKKRFQVLKRQDQYHRYRTIDQQNKIKQHQSLHENIKSQRNSLQKKIQQAKQKQLKQLRQKTQKIQNQIKNNKTQTLDSMYSSRINQYNKSKDQTELNEKIIDKNKKQFLQLNKKRKEQVIQQEKNQKIVINQFKDSHIKQTISYRQSQTNKLNSIASKKQKQLQMLMAYQQNLIKKASESIAMNQKIKNQFGKIFLDVKQRNSVRFPSINTRATGSNRSNYSDVSKSLSIYEF